MTVVIGRDQELKTLERALLDIPGGNAGCVLLRGEAGIGKSRLVEELKQLASLKKYSILQGNCFEQDLTLPYAPWIDALRSSFASLDAPGIKKILGPLTPEFMKLLPELVLLIPHIHPSQPLDPQAEKYRLFESFVRLLSSLSSSHPLLFILEDLHWTDALSLELVQYVSRRLHGQAFMLVGTYRSEQASEHLLHLLDQMKRERGVQEINLKPLPRLEVSRLTEALLQTQQHIPAGFLDALMDLTDGNPFFVEEVLKSLTADGRMDELLKRQNLDEILVPGSIQRMMQQRIEHLAETTRRVLILASVMGERISFGLLQETSGYTEQELLQALKELVDAHLVVQESADLFAFQHALTRQAVYSTLMTRERRDLHRTIGETIERLAGAHRDAAAAQLAYHFHQAEAWQKTIEYSQQAGEQAQALYAPREALKHFTHALDGAQQLGLPPPFSALRGRAHALELFGEFEQARTDYEAALELADRGSNPMGEWQLLIDLGLLWQSRDLERAGEYYQPALRLARSFEDEAILAQTLNRLGNWHFNHGQTRQAFAYHHEALALFQKLNDPRGMAQTMDLLGIASYQLGEIVQAASYLEQAAPIFRELDDRQGLVNTLTNLTLRAVTDTEVLGETTYPQMTDLNNEALQVARSFNWYQGEVLALLQGAISLEKTGEYGQALERLARVEAMQETGQNREAFARLHLILGQIYSGLIALPEAKQHFETSLALVQELGSQLLILAAKGHLATVSILQRDAAGAHGLLDDLLPTEYPEEQISFSLRRCWCACAELELMQGNPQRALTIVERLLAATPNLAKYGPYAVPFLSRLRAQAFAALGRLEDAEVELQGTLPTAVKYGQKPLLWRLHVDLGQVQRGMKHREQAEREFSSARTLIEDLADNIPQGELRLNFLKQALATMPAPPALTQLQVAKKEFGGLTAREREIAALIAHGKSNREIAGELVISEKTAERHVANILLKLGFNSRTQIGVWAAEKRLAK